MYNVEESDPCNIVLIVGGGPSDATGTDGCGTMDIISFCTRRKLYIKANKIILFLLLPSSTQQTQNTQHSTKYIVCLPVCLSACLPVCPSVCPSAYLSVCPSVHLSVCLPVCLYIHISVHPSICPSIHLLVHLSVILSSVRLFGQCAQRLTISSW